MLCAAFVLLTPRLHAEVFTYNDGAGTVSSAEITDSHVFVRERNIHPNTGREGELRCPLGRDVNATSVREKTAKLCVKFANASCTLRRVDVRGQDLRPQHGFSSFCIQMASADQARDAAAVINQTRRSPEIQAFNPTSTRRSSAQANENRTARASNASGSVLEQPATSGTASKSSSQPTSSKTEQPARQAEAQPSLRQQPLRPAGEPQTVVNPGAYPALLFDTVAVDSEQKSGRWVTSWFTIRLGGNAQLADRTYATASVVDNSGAARSPGGYLYIRNESDKYPLYYGFNDAARDKLEAGQEVTLSLTGGRSGVVALTEKTIALRWFDETATGRSHNSSQRK